MRTTVVLKDELVSKTREFSKEKTLSGLLNSCLADWIAQHRRKGSGRGLRRPLHEGVDAVLPPLAKS